jgi:hypothetical protein
VTGLSKFEHSLAQVRREVRRKPGLQPRPKSFDPDVLTRRELRVLERALRRLETDAGDVRARRVADALASASLSRSERPPGPRGGSPLPKTEKAIDSHENPPLTCIACGFTGKSWHFRNGQPTRCRQCRSSRPRKNCLTLSELSDGQPTRCRQCPPPVAAEPEPVAQVVPSAVTPVTADLPEPQPAPEVVFVDGEREGPSGPVPFRWHSQRSRRGDDPTTKVF